MARARGLSTTLGLLISMGGCEPSAAPAGPTDVAPSPALDPKPELKGPAGPGTERAPAAEGHAFGFTPEVQRVLAQRRVGPGPGQPSIALRRRGAVRLRADGPNVGLADDKPFAQPAQFGVLEDAERPRVVSARPDVRLLVYVEREDAHSLVASRAPMHSTPEATSDAERGHIVLHPGALVEVLEERGELAHVRYTSATGKPSGWVARSSLSATATRNALGEEGRSSWVTTRKVKLTETPGGRSLVALAKDRELEAVDERRGAKHMLVEYFEVCNKDYSYVGYVARASVAAPQTGFGYSCGEGRFAPPMPWGQAKSAPRIKVEAGRFLLDPDGKIIVGCTIKPVEVADLGETYAIASAWGPLPIKLAPENFQGRCGS